MKKYTLQKLNVIIQQIIEEYCDDIKFINKVVEHFAKKNIDIKVPNLLMGNNVSFSELDVIEKICFTDACYEILMWDDLNPKYYFSEGELYSYDTFIKDDSEIRESIVIKNARKVSDNQFEGYLSLKELYLCRKNFLIRYNRKTQRKGTVKTIGTKGMKVYETYLNSNAVYDIKQEFLAENFIPNLITLNVLIMDGKIPDIKFVEKFENIGDLIITPNLDRDSKFTTFVDIIDGYHRYTGACDAYEEAREKGEELQGGLLVSVTKVSLQQAKEYVQREFKRNDTDRDYLKALEENDYTKFVSKLEKNSEILKGEIAETHDEQKVFEKLTNKLVLAEAVKLTDIMVNEEVEVYFSSKKMGEIIDTMITTLMKQYNNDLKTMRDNSFFLEPNIFVGYLAIANELRKKEDYIESLLRVCERIISLKNKDLKKELGLSVKKCDVKSIYNYFLELLL